MTSKDLGLRLDSGRAPFSWSQLVKLADFPRQLRDLLAHPLSRGRKLSVVRQWITWHLASRLVPGPVLVPFVNGARLVAGRRMTNVNVNFYTGLAEPAEMAFLAHFLRPSDLFFDVGANAGVMTVLAAAASGCRCVSFEPVPESVEALRLHVRLNGYEDLVTVVQKALGDTIGSARLSLDAGPMNHVVSAAVPQPVRQVHVRVTTLDHEVATFGVATVLKIDVEGFEAARARRRFLLLEASELRAVIMEVNRHARRYQYSAEDIFDRMRAAGLCWVTYDMHSRSVTRSGAVPFDGTHIFVRDPGEASERTAGAAPLRGHGFRL